MLYNKFTLGSSTNYITFNDEDNVDYYIRAQRRAVTKRDIRQFDSVVPDELGVVDFQTLLGKEHFVITGKIYPIGGENSLYRAMADMRKACSPAITQADNDSDYGYVLLKWGEDVNKQLRVKPLYVDIPESIANANTPEFKIFCKIKYPVIEAQATDSVTLSPAITAGSGLVIPASGLVIPDNGVVIGADSGSASVTVVNNGDYKAYPTITLHAPLNNPRITNASTGKYIEFNYNLASGSITVVIDYDGVTAESNDGTNLLNYITSGSDIENFYIREGDNNLTLTAATLGTGASAVVSFRDSWPL